jgi:uncharacterized protein (TIGR02594 family)
VSHIHIPLKWRWLLNEAGPKHLVEALRHYGVKEKTGALDNLIILSWAQELGVLGVFTKDEIPWCGLFVGYVMHSVGREPPTQFYRAAQWTSWGAMCGGGPQLGDVLVFARPGGAHVGFYVGEGTVRNEKVYWVLGGNQNDQVSIVPIARGRLSSCRRPRYVRAPLNIRRVRIEGDGTLSTNES